MKNLQNAYLHFLAVWCVQIVNMAAAPALDSKIKALLDRIDAKDASVTTDVTSLFEAYPDQHTSLFVQFFTHLFTNYVSLSLFKRLLYCHVVDLNDHIVATFGYQKCDSVHRLAKLADSDAKHPILDEVRRQKEVYAFQRKTHPVRYDEHTLAVLCVPDDLLAALRCLCCRKDWTSPLVVQLVENDPSSIHVLNMSLLIVRKDTTQRRQRQAKRFNRMQVNARSSKSRALC